MNYLASARIAAVALVAGMLAGCSISASSEGQHFGVGGAAGAGGQGGEGGEGGTSQDGGTDAADTKPSMACDELKACGNYSEGCTACAVTQDCAEPYQNCFADEQCLYFSKCFDACKKDVGCQQACAEMNPQGADRHTKLIRCIVCEACPTSCASIAPICN
jgi:hypothetical protein